jgi:hypothetical protein
MKNQRSRGVGPWPNGSYRSVISRALFLLLVGACIVRGRTSLAATVSLECETPTPSPRRQAT